MADPILACLVEFATNDEFRQKFAKATPDERMALLADFGDVGTLPTGFVKLIVSDDPAVRRTAFADFLAENVQISGDGDQKSMLRALSVYLDTKRRQ